MLYYYYIFPTVLFFALLRKIRTMKWGYCKNNVKLQGKVVIVTGANSGIGYEIAKELANREAKVIIACRDLKKANEAICKMISESKNTILSTNTLIPMRLDLASMNSIFSFVQEFNQTFDKLDILINNAGVSLPKTETRTTEDGLEIQFGVNHVGHFLLTNMLLLKLKESSRVIIVSSTLHQKGHIYLDDLNLNDKNGKSGQYENSKLANAYFGIELSKRVKDNKINVYTVCPGWVYTGLFRNYNIKWYHYIAISPIAFWFMRTPKQGAQTIIFCATDPSLENETGNFYRDCKPFKSSVNFDPNVSLNLWNASNSLVKKYL